MRAHKNKFFKHMYNCNVLTITFDLCIFSSFCRVKIRKKVYTILIAWTSWAYKCSLTLWPFEFTKLIYWLDNVFDFSTLLYLNLFIQGIEFFLWNEENKPCPAKSGGMVLEVPRIYTHIHTHTHTHTHTRARARARKKENFLKIVKFQHWSPQNIFHRSKASSMKKWRSNNYCTLIYKNLIQTYSRINITYLI